MDGSRDTHVWMIWIDLWMDIGLQQTIGFRLIDLEQPEGVATTLGKGKNSRVHATPPMWSHGRNHCYELMLDA